MGWLTFDSLVSVDYFGARASTCRLPWPLLAGSVAAVAGQKVQHIRNRGFDSQYYRDMIVALVREHQPVSREDIDKLLLDKLPEVLTQEQKLNRVHNLLRQLADAG
jgi:ATP-dependent DNA helicase RecG